MRFDGGWGGGGGAFKGANVARGASAMLVYFFSFWSFHALDILIAYIGHYSHSVIPSFYIRLNG